MSGAESERAAQAWAAGCCLAYLLLAFATISVWEHSHDEGVTYQQAIGPLTPGTDRERPTPVAELYAKLARPQPLRGVLRELAEPGGMHPPAYYLLLNVWSRAFGTSQLALAFPTLLAAIGGLLALRALAAQLLGSAAGRWAMALCAVSPWFVGYTVLLRPYGLAICIAIAATLASLRLAHSSRPLPPAAAFVGLSVLGLYSIYHYAFVLLWHGALLVLLALFGARVQRARRIAWAAGAGLAVALLFAPWLARLLFHLDITSARPWYFSGLLPLAMWPARTALVASLFGLGELAIEPVGAAQRWALALLGGLTLAAALAGLAARWRALAPELRALLITAPLIPVSVAIADLLRDAHTLFYSKLMFGVFPLLVLAITGAARSLRPRWARAALVGAWVVLFASASIVNVFVRARTQNSLEALATHLRDTSGQGRVQRLIVPSSRHGSFIPLVLTLRDAGVEGVELQYVSADRFDAWLPRALREPSGGRFTLANVALLASQTDASWTRSQLERALEHARSLGWGTRLLRLGRPTPPPPPGRPTLWLMPTLAPKYFSM